MALPHNQRWLVPALIGGCTRTKEITMKNSKTITTVRAPKLSTDRVDTVATVDLTSVIGGCAACGGACGMPGMGARRWR